MKPYAIYITTLCMISMLTLSFPQQNTIPLPAGEILIDAFEQPPSWKTYHDCSSSLSSDIRYEGMASLKWVTKISRARHSVRGVWIDNLGLPLPEKISFYVYPESTYLFISIGDGKGTTAGKFIIPDLKAKQWNSVVISLQDMLPMGRPEASLDDLECIFFGIQDAAGEFPRSGEYTYYFDEIRALYPFPIFRIPLPEDIKGFFSLSNTWKKNISIDISLLSPKNIDKITIGLEVKRNDESIITKRFHTNVAKGKVSTLNVANYELSGNGLYQHNISISIDDAEADSVSYSFYYVEKDEVFQRIEKAQGEFKIIARLLEEARAAKIHIHPQEVSSSVIELFSGYARDEANEGQLERADRQATYLLETSRRTIEELQSLLEGARVQPSIPEPNLANLAVREGAFYAKQEPVLLTGLIGWDLTDQLPLFKKMGFNVISIESGPDKIFPGPGKEAKQWDYVMEHLEAGKENNIAVDVLLSPHYFPAWAYEGDDEIDRKGFRRRRNPFMPWNVSSRDFRMIIENYLKIIIPLMKDASHLLSYDLTNELWYELGPDYSIADFQVWLQTRYKDNLNELNNTWGSSFRSFKEANLALDSPASWIELLEFNKARVIDFYIFMRDIIKTMDATTPIYCKTIASDYEVLGVDKELLGDVLSGNGMDAYPNYLNSKNVHAVDNGYSIDLWTQAIVLDMFNSYHPDKPVFDSEYHIIPYGALVSSEYVRTVLWHGALHGRDMVTAWVWGRTLENELDSLFTQPWAVESLGLTSLEMRRLAAYIVAFSRRKAHIALYHGGHDLKKTYEALTFLDTYFDFISDRHIIAGKLGEYSLLIVPEYSTLSREALFTLVTWLRSGGHVWVGYKGLTRDPYGKEHNLAKILPEADEVERRLGKGRIRAEKTELSAHEQSRIIDRIIDEAGIVRSVRIQDTGRETSWGIEARVAEQGDALLLYLINMTRKPATISLKTSYEFTTLQNLVDDTISTPPFVLQPLDPMLLKMNQGEKSK